MSKVELTDIDGVRLTSANTSGLNNGLYSITFSGIGTDYAYIGVDGKLSLEIKSINIFTKSAVTLVGGVEYYAEGTITDNGSWINKSTHDFDLTTVESRTYNDIFSGDETIDSTPMRVEITTGGACTVYIKVVKR